jgi:hypothetical protein
MPRNFHRIAAMACALMALAPDAESKPPTSTAPESGWWMTLDGKPSTPEEAPVRICLRRPVEKRVLGVWDLFGPWEAEIDPSRTYCDDEMYADLKTKTLYVCSKFYFDCTSVFFRPDQLSSSGVRLSEHTFAQAMRESGLLEKLDRFKAEHDQREAQRIATEKAAIELAKLEGYRAEAQAATSITPLLEFVKRYEHDDPESLVVEARARLAKLQQAYLEGSHSSKDIAFFIKTFEREDPAGLIPQAHRKLAKTEAAEARVGKIRSLRANIAGCMATIRRAQSTIAREQQIKALTGTVSLGALHEAGSQLLLCQDAIPALYKQYRAAGGKEPLEAIR